MSLYDELGLLEDADEQEIAVAFRRAAKQHHPDVGGDPEKFQRIQFAAMILRDPVKRALYDRDGTTEDQPDNTLAAAMRVLSAAFQNAFSQAKDLARTDIVGLAVANIQEQLKSVKANQDAAREKRDRLSNALERLSYKGNRPNLIANMLGEQIRTINKQLGAIERDEEACRKALEMARDYSWKLDPEP